MISKRTRRNPHPQENLRQFSLNSSKGIDETKPITDVNTIVGAINLKNNPDGSLSLRDPIGHVCDIKCAVTSAEQPIKAFPIFNNAYFVVAEDGSGGVVFKDFVPDDSGLIGTVYHESSHGVTVDENGAAKFTLRWTSYDNTVLNDTGVEPHSSVFANKIDFTDVEVIKTNTSVTLGNCKIFVNSFANIIDDTLYDSTVSYVYRYVQIYFEDSVLVFEVKRPEINTLTTADGEMALTINTTLDNPYAISDTYLTGATDIKGIIPFAYSDKDLNLTHTSGLNLNTLKVKELTESVKETRFRPVTAIGNVSDIVSPSANRDTVFFKAFGSFPNSNTGDYTITWASDNSSVCAVTPTADTKACIITPKNPGETRVTAKYGDLVKTCKVTLEHKYARLFFTNYLVLKADEPNDEIPLDITPLTSEKTSPKPLGDFKILNTNPGIRLGTPELKESSNGDVWYYHTVLRYPLGLPEGYYTYEYVYTHLSGEVITGTVTIRRTGLVNPEPRTVTSEYASYDDYSEPVMLLSEGGDDTSVEVPESGIFSISSTELNFYVGDTARTITTAVANNAAKVYGAWSVRFQNGTYRPIVMTLPPNVERIPVREEVESFKIAPSVDVKEDKSSTRVFQDVTYALISNLTSSNDVVKNRADVLAITSTEGLKDSLRFKVIVPKALSTDDEAYDSDAGGDQWGVGIVLDVSEYTPNLTQNWEFADYALKNSAAGKKLLYKNSIYSYGDEDFENTLFKSYAGSLITPYLNSITADNVGTSKITSVTPWRDYLYITTETGAVLAIPNENGFYTKIVNTFIGVPYEDSKCCKTALNGIVFKSGSKIYLGYPNVYSEEATTLNYTELSKPIESILEQLEYSDAYAITTASEYKLFLLQDDCTYTLNYDYVNKVWTVFRYPKKLVDAYNHPDGSVHAFYKRSSGNLVEITLNGETSDLWQDEVYVEDTVTRTPIQFLWDSGQKTDAISFSKQFVESKIMFATLSEEDAFPFTTYVAIDGDPRVITTDVSTDAPFWKTSESRGVLNTAFSLGGSETPASGTFNTLRQLVLRYSGKGKSIRHVIEGNSLYNFKLYECYVRYKTLNGK